MALSRAGSRTPVLKWGIAMIDDIIRERTENYGSFEGVAILSQSLKSVMQSHDHWVNMLPDEREALEMIAHKMARIINGNAAYKDSWNDISGYAKLVADKIVCD